MAILKAAGSGKISKHYGDIINKYDQWIGGKAGKF